MNTKGCVSEPLLNWGRFLEIVVSLLVDQENIVCKKCKVSRLVLVFLLISLERIVRGDL